MLSGFSTVDQFLIAVFAPPVLVVVVGLLWGPAFRREQQGGAVVKYVVWDFWYRRQSQAIGLVAFYLVFLFLTLNPLLWMAGIVSLGLSTAAAMHVIGEREADIVEERIQRRRMLPVRRGSLRNPLQ